MSHVVYVAQWRMPASRIPTQRRLRPWLASLSGSKRACQDHIDIRGSHDNCEYRIVKYKLVRA